MRSQCRELIIVPLLLAVTSALSLERLPATKGRLIVLRVQDDESLTAYALSLRDEAVRRGEILWADDWESVPLNLCGKKALRGEGCSSVEWVHGLNEGKKANRVGEKTHVSKLSEVVGALLEIVDVDAFFHGYQLDSPFWRMYSSDVINHGPGASFEWPGSTLGEHHLFGSVLEVMMSLDRSLLVLDYAGEAYDRLHDHARALEMSLLRLSRRRLPLMYCWLKLQKEPKKCDELSGYPAQCTLKSQQYWGSEQGEIHATPDLESRTSGELGVPVLVATCHADDTSPASTPFILYYDNNPEHPPNMTTTALIHKATGLSVKVVAKRAECSSTPPGVECGHAVGLVGFHNLLRQARVVVAPLAATDNPSLLEATACGTPVMVQRGQHQMLERYGLAPHVAMWDDWGELQSGLEAALRATSAGDHKLQPWVPAPLTQRSMLKGVQTLLEASRISCDHAA